MMVLKYYRSTRKKWRAERGGQRTEERERK